MLDPVCDKILWRFSPRSAECNTAPRGISDTKYSLTGISQEWVTSLVFDSGRGPGVSDLGVSDRVVSDFVGDCGVGDVVSDCGVGDFGLDSGIGDFGLDCSVGDFGLESCVGDLGTGGFLDGDGGLLGSEGDGPEEVTNSIEDWISPVVEASRPLRIKFLVMR